MRSDGPIHGRLLTDPGGRAVLRVDPLRDPETGRSRALLVRVETELGRPLAELRATDLEVTRVEAPDPTTGRLRAYPGAFWFYDRGGAAIGFMADDNAGALALPMAVEAPRRGLGTGLALPREWDPAGMDRY